MTARRRRSHLAAALLIGAAAGGCGALEPWLVQTGEAGARVLLDLLITGAQNEILDALQTPPVPGDGEPPPPDDPVLAGQEIYTANGCWVCHCEDARGGCALDAPSNRNAGFVLLDSILRGDAEHAGGKFNLSDQELQQLEAFLASLGSRRTAHAGPLIQRTGAAAGRTATHPGRTR